MIIEMFLLRDVKRNPKSVSCELTPETMAEEDILRSAKIIHKNQIMVWWGDTVELGIVHGSLRGKDRTEEFLGFDGLKVNFKIPMELPKYNRKEKDETRKKRKICFNCGYAIGKNGGKTLCRKCLDKMPDQT